MSLRTLFAASIIAISGCGESQEPTNQRPVFPTHGSITFAGKPIPDATIRLHPVLAPQDGMPLFIPHGRVDKQGKFALTTYRLDDGAPDGEYQISLSWQGSLQGIDEDEEDQLRELLPRKYTSPKSSGLKVVITKDDNQIPAIAIN